MKVWLTVSAFFLPLITNAQQLVPVQCNDPRTCGSCELVALINNVIQFLIQISVVIAAIVLVYAGFLMVTSTGSPAQISKAKTLFINVVIGLVLLLAAFLIVNTILSALLRTGSPALSWQTIQCVYPTASTDLLPYQQTSVIGGGTSGGGTLGGGGLVLPGGRGEAQCAPGNNYCSVDALQALGLSATQANVMSCIAVTESGGRTGLCSGTGPCGTFQITETNWRLYTEGSGAAYPQCSAANFGGNITAAQNDGTCNKLVMSSMVQDSGYQPWTGANTDPTDNVPDGPWNPYARGCVNTHSTTGDTTTRGF